MVLSDVTLGGGDISIIREDVTIYQRYIAAARTMALRYIADIKVHLKYRSNLADIA